MRSRDPRRLDPLATPHHTYIVLDTETTGLDPSDGAQLIEIGAVHIRDDRKIGEFHQLIDPHTRIPEQVTRLTGITPRMTVGPPDVRQAMALFDRWLPKDSIVMAHNAGFDIRFLDRAEADRGNRFFHHMYVDTLEMSRLLHPEKPRHRVVDLIRDYHVGDCEEHRALSDALQEQRLYECMRDEAFQD